MLITVSIETNDGTAIYESRYRAARLKFESEHSHVKQHDNGCVLQTDNFNDARAFLVNCGSVNERNKR